MTIGMWFADDLANVLRGIAVAALPAGSAEYQAGFQAALFAVAVGLGIPVASLTPPHVTSAPGAIVVPAL